MLHNAVSHTQARRLARKIVWMLALWGFTAGLSACSTGSLEVKDAWVRPGLTGDNSAIYFRIENPTGDEDELLGASTQAARFVELHESMMEHGGTMSMHPKSSIPIPAKGSLDFQPGGLHVMLIELTGDLVDGDRLQLTLEFKNAGLKTIEVPVQQP